MKEEILNKLVELAKKEKIKYSPGKPTATMHFWTKLGQTFHGHMIMLDAERFYELCKSLKLIN